MLCISGLKANEIPFSSVLGFIPIVWPKPFYVGRSRGCIFVKINKLLNDFYRTFIPSLYLFFMYYPMT